MPQTPFAWFQFSNQAGMEIPSSSPTSIALVFRITPLGTLEPCTRSIVPRNLCTQIHVWAKRILSHSEAQQEARENAINRGHPDPFPPSLFTSGAIADTNIIPHILPHSLRIGTNPSHFLLPFTPTDRFRAPISIASTDITHLYHIQTSDLYIPIRTLDPHHIPTTSSSTSYTHLLHHLDTTTNTITPPAAVRYTISTTAKKNKLPPNLLETQLNVLSDAFHIGHRCTKRSCTKGICDLCFYLLGRSTPETTRHILLTCPFTQPVITAIWRKFFSSQSSTQCFYKFTQL